MSSASNRRRPPGGFTLIEALVAVAIAAIVITVLMYVVQNAREAARRLSCQNNLRQLGLALHNYSDAYGVLPAGIDSAPRGAEPAEMWSWQMKVLPYCDQAPLYNRLNVAGGIIDPANRAHFDSRVPAFQCPADPSAKDVYEEKSGPFAGRWAVTSYLGVSGVDGVILSGTGSLLSPHQCGQLDQDYAISTGNGILYGGSSVRLTEITDGTSMTLMIGERIVPRGGERGWWTGPGLAAACPAGWTDVVLPASDILGFGGVRTASGGFQDWYHWSSHHSKGVHFVTADNSVRFVKFNVDPTLFQSFCTRAAGDTPAD